jgi:hypothetical protein
MLAFQLSRDEAIETAGWIFALCLCSGVVWAETESFGTGEVDRTMIMVGDRVDVAKLEGRHRDGLV